MTNDALIEELAAAIYPDNLSKYHAIAILTIIQRERIAAGQAVKEAAKSQFSIDAKALDEPDYVDFVYDCIRALNVEAIVGDKTND